MSDNAYMFQLGIIIFVIVISSFWILYSAMSINIDLACLFDDDMRVDKRQKDLTKIVRQLVRQIGMTWLLLIVVGWWMVIEAIK